MKSGNNTTTTAKIDELKNRQENRKCFDCHEKVCSDFSRYKHTYRARPTQ